jgi:hypothetical protein
MNFSIKNVVDISLKLVDQSPFIIDNPFLTQNKIII